MSTHEMKENACPDCGKLLDRATNVSGSNEEPSPGDITICNRCGSFLTFAQDLSLELLDPEEFNELDEEFKNQLLKIQEYIIMSEHALEYLTGKAFNVQDN